MTDSEHQSETGAFPQLIDKAALGDHPSLQSWLSGNRHSLLESLEHCGAILFRGLGVDNAQAFDEFIDAFGLESFTYAESLSNAVRKNVTDRVFTANEAPPEVEIFLHHEMAQTPLFPSRLFFYCEIAAERGGETPLCRSDRLLERLKGAEPAFVERCTRLGVRYANVMPGHDDAQSGQGRSWRSTLGVSDRSDAEARLMKLGYDFEWLDGDVLRVTTPALPAVRRLNDGREVFFNQLIAAFRGWQDSRNDARKSVCFGDDSPMDAEALQSAAGLADELSYDLAWQPGDVALVDNFLVMHGRRPFEGSRRVLASLVADRGDRSENPQLARENTR